MDSVKTSKNFCGGGGGKHSIYQLSQVGSIGAWNLEIDFSVGEDVVLISLLSDQTVCGNEL